MNKDIKFDSKITWSKITDIRLKPKDPNPVNSTKINHYTTTMTLLPNGRFELTEETDYLNTPKNCLVFAILMYICY